LRKRVERKKRRSNKEDWCKSQGEGASIARKIQPLNDILYSTNFRADHTMHLMLDVQQRKCIEIEAFNVVVKSYITVYKGI
jgi:hypothetical protein